MRVIANFVSYIFHPIFIFTYLYILYWVLYPYPSFGLRFEGIALVTGLIFLNTAVFPVGVLLFRKKSLVNQNRVERQQTIITVVVIYGFTYFFFPQKFIPDYLRAVLLSTIIGLFIAFIINRKMKISLHASAWGGCVSVLLYLLFQIGGSVFFNLFMLGTLIAGLVGFSRLFLNAHTDRELYTGYLSGFLITCLVLFTDLI